MRTQKEKLNLLKEACEIGLSRDPKLLEGKSIEFSKKCGLMFNPNSFSEFENVSDDSVKILIQPKSEMEDLYSILLSNNMPPWFDVAEYLKDCITEKLETDTYISDQLLLDGKILALTLKV